MPTTYQKKLYPATRRKHGPWRDVTSDTIAYWKKNSETDIVNGYKVVTSVGGSTEVKHVQEDSSILYKDSSGDYAQYGYWGSSSVNKNIGFVSCRWMVDSAPSQQNNQTQSPYCWKAGVRLDWTHKTVGKYDCYEYRTSSSRPRSNVLGLEGNTWYHLAYGYTGTNVVCYVNGEKVRDVAAANNTQSYCEMFRNDAGLSVHIGDAYFGKTMPSEDDIKYYYNSTKKYYVSDLGPFTVTFLTNDSTLGTPSIQTMVVNRGELITVTENRITIGSNTVTYTPTSGNSFLGFGIGIPSYVYNNLTIMGWFGLQGMSALYLSNRGGIIHDTINEEIIYSDDIGRKIITADKNLGASTIYNYGDTRSLSNCGYVYQRGNNYGFSPVGTLSESSSNNVIDASSYGPGNYYNDSTWRTKDGWDSSKNRNLRGDVADTEYARQGPCPNGWHIPSKDELNLFQELYTYICDGTSEWKQFSRNTLIPYSGRYDPSSFGLDYLIWSSSAVSNSNTAYMIRKTRANTPDWAPTDARSLGKRMGLGIRPFKNTYTLVPINNLWTGDEDTTAAIMNQHPYDYYLLGGCQSSLRLYSEGSMHNVYASYDSNTNTWSVMEVW